MDNQAEQHYKMTGKKGMALIINISQTLKGPREFSNADVAELFRTFKSSNFEVRKEVDLSKDAIIKTLQDASRMNYQDYGCFVCFILSCGDYGVVEGTDGPVQVDQFLEFFKGDTCPSLAGKPKIFIFQACNPLIYKKLDSDSGDNKTRKTYTIPSEADFLMVWSLVPGDLTTPSPSTLKGSVFITALCQRLVQAAGKEEINRILTKVLRDTSTRLESDAPNTLRKANFRLPCVINMLTKLLYLPISGRV